MRTGRAAFWRFALFNFAVVAAFPLAAFSALRLLHIDGPRFIAWVVNPWLQSLFYLPTFFMAGRRLHDIGRAAWPVWLFFVLFAGRIYLLLTGMVLLFALGHFATPSWLMGTAYLGPALLGVVGVGGWVAWLCAQPGDHDTNRYGPPPGSANQDIEPPPEPRPATRPDMRSGSSSSRTSIKPSFGRRSP
jgi:uncharacterized membrane protein YhaH (DUF805 family)